MQKSSKIYLSSLLHLLHQHPHTRGESFAHWDKTDAGHRETQAQFWEKVLRTVAPGLNMDEQKAKGELKALFAYLGQQKEGDWKFPLCGKNAQIVEPTKEQTHNYLSEWQKMLRQDLQNAPEHPEAGNAAEQLLFILEKNGVTLPSGYHEALSLYDFAKMFAATAICLHENQAEQPFLLINGGLAGIQDYLYDIISRKASKNLKGRSFFVQLLSDTVMAEVLDTLGLFRANAVYASGSKFMVLAPNSPENRQKLADFKKTLAKRLFEEFKTRVYLELEWTELADLSFASLDAAREANSVKSSAQKSRKFAEFLAESQPLLQSPINKQLLNGYDYFFEPMPINGAEERDCITNEELFDPKEIRQLESDDTDTDTNVHITTHRQIELGKDLQRAETLVSTRDILQISKVESINIAQSLINHYLLKQDEKTPANLNDGFVLRLGSNQIEWTKNSKAVMGFMLYAGNKVPSEHDKPIEFDKLAGEDRFKRLGFLRMDIDGLGKTFKNLFDKKVNPRFPATLVAYSAISRNLDYFVKGIVNQIWKDTTAYKASIQIIYAGGDDLFVVGKWDQVIYMAADIRRKFKNWVCENPDLSISGGIELVTPKFPAVKAAGTAADMEDAAKAHQFEGKQKNAITIFKNPLQWDNEFEEVLRLKNKLKELAADNTLPRGFFTKIQGLFEQAAFQRQNDRAEAWRWRIAYDFVKMAERKQNNKKLKDLLDDIKHCVLTGKPHNPVYSNGYQDAFKHFNLVRLAANWADFETRT